MSDITNARLQEVVNHYLKHGEEQTAKHFKISQESLGRYLRKAKIKNIHGNNLNKILRDIQELYSEDELVAISKGGRIVPGMTRVPTINFDGERVRIGHLTDTHIGSLFSEPNRLMQAFDEFRKEKVDFITHSGDVTEGMSHRAGHIYELKHLGYAAQKAEAVRLFGQWTDTDIYAIDGNHDRWFLKSNGAKIVEDISATLDNFHFIGHDEGDISLKGKVVLKLWHGEDGNSYALSYRIQKILESLTGGEKPHILVAGHTHKYVKMFERNVYAFSVGTMQRQTPWMRGKRIAAHVGFSIGDYWVNKDGLAKMRETWYPFYA